MFSGLLDNLASALGGAANDASWARVIAAFLKKHPDVLFCDDHLQGKHAPGGFIVWKFGRDGYRVGKFNAGSPVAAGSYGVQLFPSREEAEVEAYRRRFGPDGVMLASRTAEAGSRTVITGIGAFDVAAPAGELTSCVYDGSFSMLVLYEDGPRFAS